MSVTDDDIRDILTETRVIALVGWSPNPARPSHGVARFLAAHGYRVIPVNPGQSGGMALGERIRGSLSEITEPVDMIDIFRAPEAIGPIVDEALDRFPELKTVWMQLGLFHAEAAAKARARGVRVVENRCPAIEYPRLIGA